MEKNVPGAHQGTHSACDSHGVRLFPKLGCASVKGSYRERQLKPGLSWFWHEHATSVERRGRYGVEIDANLQVTKPSQAAPYSDDVKATTDEGLDVGVSAKSV